MKKAVKHLEQFLERAEGYTKGKVVLATVYGDVHDIGKSLVNTILSNNGYTVFDLGKQVPVNTIIEKALEVDADAIGLSALLVSTSKQMPLCVQELDRRGLKIPVLIGGAAINRRFGRRALFVEGERAYDSGVFYCKDAFEGLETMDRLQDPERRGAFIAKLLDDARNDKFLHTNVGKDMSSGTRAARAATSPRTIRCRRRRSSARARSRTFRSTRCSRCSISTSCIACSGADAAQDRSTKRRCARVRADARASQGIGEARRMAAAAGGLRAISRCRRAGNDLVVYDPDAYAADGTHARDLALPLSAAGRS